MDITACYIVRDESEQLQKSLQTVREAGITKAVVVDTGSVDNSKQAAADWGAECHDFHWCEDFAAARNFALQWIHSRWVLFLDADEYLKNPAEWIPYIQKLEKEHPETEAVFSKRLEYDTAQHSVQQVTMVVRLFRGDAGLLYQGRIHEILQHPQRALNMHTESRALQIVHTGYAEGRGTKKVHRNLKILKELAEKNGMDAWLRFYLCQSYFGLHDFQKAYHYADEALKEPSPLFQGHMDLFHWKIEAMRQLDKPLTEMLHTADEAIRAYPDWPDFYGERGMILCGMGELNEAEESLRTALDRYASPSFQDLPGSYFTERTAVQIRKRLSEIAEMKSKFSPKNLAQAYQQAEQNFDLDGRAACVIAAMDMVQQEPRYEGTPDITFLEERISVVFCALFQALQQGNLALAQYYATVFPEKFLAHPAALREYRYYKGIIACGLGKYLQAASYLIAHLQSYQKDELAWFALGNARYLSGQYADAKVCYDQALQWKPWFAEAIANRQKVQDVLNRQMDNPLPIQQTVDTELGLDPKDWEQVRKIPILINCRDRVECLSKLVQWLLHAGYQRIILLDNASTYRPLLSYYERMAGEYVQIIRMNRNYGHRALWESGVLRQLDIRTPYVYTDPDVVPGDACPPNFLQYFAQVLQAYPYIRKVGAGLIYEEDTCYDKENLRKRESALYRIPLEPEVFFAGVDTTFALYRNMGEYQRSASLRITGPYRFQHLPWYYDPKHLPEDEKYYLAHANTSSSMGAFMQK